MCWQNDMSKSSSKVSSVTVPSTAQTKGHILNSPNLKRFNFSELKAATRDFGQDTVLASGATCTVFEGWIDCLSLKPSGPDTGMPVAVKRLRDNRGQQEWLSEIRYMGQLLHPNLVKLIGYCLEDDHRLLVYEFVPNGSLENRLFGSHVSKKSDKYSFGIVLLEMLSGRRAIELDRQSEPIHLGEHSGSSALKVAQLAYECVSGEPKFRPDIKDVVKILENLQDNVVCKSSSGSKQWKRCFLS
ncbi:hypothetical protein JCGZ_06622 [Jatropha curcas]|uniref:Protein kinase domain-containing protein n=1 Tax=Jatropha curcas TaxID=180498 RepID=A0A067LCA0_JATCU|nr:hypothetical protein JCGZ_06622 [Jatropha curcas]